MSSSPRTSPTTAVGSADTFAPVLAIDYGRKRWGLAISDPLGVISRPLATWNRTNRRRDLARLRELLQQYGVRRIVVGLPLHMNGEPSEMSEEASRFASRLKKIFGLPVDMAEERLTSWEAVRRVRSTGRRSAAIDAFAAAIILREYLASRRGQAINAPRSGTGC